MKKLFAVLMLLLVVTAISFAQQNVSAPQKFALVIGNANYTGMTPLKNPVNDANDMEAALKGLNFNVEKVLNGNLDQIEKAIIRLKNRLSVSKNSYGFFFYAGHGVQSGGVNYLIPVGASIPSENALRERAVSVQFMLGELNDAGNDLNVIVLDACRDNPFSWARSGSRGLTVVSNQPADSIIVYATSAGSTASDGTDRNGLFTSHLLTQLKTPGLTVREVFDRTGSAVARASERKQVPAIYSQYFDTAYLGSLPTAIQPSSASQSAHVFEHGSVSIATGSLEISTVTAGTLQITGGALNQRSELPEWGTLPIAKINAGSYRVSIRYSDGKTEEKTVEIGRNESKKLEFTYKPAPASVAQTTPAVQPAPASMVRINGGTFTMGSPANEPNSQSSERPRRQVTVSSFSMSRYEVTQKEYQEIMGTNPSSFKGDNLPVVNVTWFDAIEYCNKRSQKEGLTPAYTITGRTPVTGYPITAATVTVNWNTNGYRLPTEAEWEYACRAGTKTAYNTGASISDNTGWYKENSGGRIKPVEQKPANAWGLHDMHGNVWEWCWDWYGAYQTKAQTDPRGATAGVYRVARGGSWNSSAESTRSASRFIIDPGNRFNHIGFRLLRP